MQAKKIDAVFVKQLLADKKWNDVVVYLKEYANSKNIFVLTSLYKAHNNLKNYNTMEKYLDEILVINSDNATFWKDKGLCFYRRDEWKDAFLCFSNAISINNNIPMYFALRAKCSIELHNYEQAIKDYRRALELNPENLNWLKNLGNILVKNNEIANAIKVYEKILTYDDNFHYEAIYCELKTMLELNTTDITSKYYDRIFTNSDKYLSNPNLSIYSSIWKYILDIIKMNNFKNILDLGCGPGQFAEFIANSTLKLNYTGIDFSQEAINIAKKRCPKFFFEKNTLPIDNLEQLYDFDLVICTEVLEHVTYDKEILNSIPNGIPIICSVPNFDSFGHVRFFKSEKEVKSRYKPFFNDLSIRHFKLSEKNIIWLMYGSK